MSQPHTLEEIHAVLAGIAGSLSFALVRRRVKPANLRAYAAHLALAAADLETLAQAIDEKLSKAREPAA